MNEGLQIYSLDPIGIGTAYVESMTSYITRIAKAQRCSPRSLLAALNLLGDKVHKAAACYMVGEEGRTINSYGITQMRILGAVSRATKRRNLHLLCLSELRSVLSENKNGAVKAQRHWCPSCFTDARKKDHEAYDMLFWQIIEVEYCPVHGDKLVSKCEKCGQHQMALPTHRTLDACSNPSCGNWLGSTSRAIPGIEESANAYQVWLISAVSELLIQLDELPNILMGDECSKFVSSLCQVRNVNIEQLSEIVHMPRWTLDHWTRRGGKPMLKTWFRFCANVNINPGATFCDPILAAKQLPLPIRSASIYKPTREGPKQKHSREIIVSAVKSQLSLKIPTVGGIKELAESLGTKSNMLYYYAGNDAKLLNKKIEAINKAKLRKRREIQLKSARRLVKRRLKNSQMLDRKSFIKELQSRTTCPLYIAKILFTKVMDEYRDGKLVVAD